MRKLNIILARGLSISSHMHATLLEAAMASGREIAIHTSEFTPPEEEETIRLMIGHVAGAPVASAKSFFESIKEEAEKCRVEFEEMKTYTDYQGLGRETAYERRNPNQPFYANIKRKGRRRHQ